MPEENRMRTEEEQTAGLEALGAEIRRRGGTGWSVRTPPGDVSVLKLFDLGDQHEFVYAVGEYDHWQDGHPQDNDLSLEQAAKLAIDLLAQVKSTVIDGERRRRA